ncbi:hypothetical protein ACOMHN_047055 [Nucella lapillus]
MAGWISTHCLSFTLVMYTVIVVLLLVNHLSQLLWPTTAVKHRQTYHQALWNHEKNSHLFLGNFHAPVNHSAVRTEVETQNQGDIQRRNKSPFPKKTGRNLVSGSLLKKNLEETFQPVNNDTIFVYSAYLRNLSNHEEVTVVVIVNRSAMAPPHSEQISCVYGGVGTKNSIVRGKLEMFPDHHGRVFSPAYVSCPALKTPLPQTRPSPTTVSLSIPQDQTLANRVRIQTPGERRYQFLVCFSPLHGAFGDMEQIVANLELAKILGAEQAVVYNTSVSPRVDRILRYYTRKGFLRVKNWSHPPEPIHYKGQLGAINDCLLQNRHC